MKNLQKMGGIAALYAGAAYVVGMLGFGLIVGWPDDPVQQMAVLMDNQVSLHILYLIVYQVWAIVSGCPGAGALRAVEGRLAGNDADSDRHRDDLGHRGHCQRHDLEYRHGHCRRSLWPRPGSSYDGLVGD